MSLSRERLRKRTYLLYATVILSPLPFYFGVLNYRNEGWTINTLICAIGALISQIVIIALRYHDDERIIMRFAMLFLLAILTTILAVGSGDGSGYCWFYIYPLIAYYVFGQQEGSLWMAASWIAALAFGYLNVGPHSYSSAIGGRFIVSYTQVILFAYGLERSRSYHYDRLMAEKLKVETTLQQVHTLQNLLPICVSCKNIRDDAGYWHQVESYMSTHVGMEFSHGICPDCRKKLDESLNRLRTGKRNRVKHFLDE